MLQRREGSSEQGGSAQSSRSETQGQEGCRTRSQDGSPRPGALATEGARAAPLGAAPLRETQTARPSARSRRRLPLWDGTGCGWGQVAGLGSAAAGPHSLTMPGCDCRGGGQAGAQQPQRASREPRARRLHWCRSVFERSEGDTHTHIPAHTGAPRGEGMWGRAAAHCRPRLHARTPGAGGGGAPLCLFPLAVLEAPHHQSPGHPLINKANEAGKGSEPGVLPVWLARGGPNLPFLCQVQPWRRVPPYRPHAAGAGVGVSASLCHSLAATLAEER